MLPRGTKRISSVLVHDRPDWGGDLAATIFVDVGWGAAITGEEPGCDELTSKIQTSPPAISTASKPNPISRARFLRGGADKAAPEGEAGTGAGGGFSGATAGRGWIG